MKLRITKEPNILGKRMKSEYNVHHSEQIGDKTYYYVDFGDNEYVFSFTQATIKGWAVIESGETVDLYDKLSEEYGKEEDDAEGDTQGE